MNKKVIILVVALAVVAAGAVVYFKVADRDGAGGDNLLVPVVAADIYEDSNRLEVNQGSVTVTRSSGEEEEITTKTTVDVGDTIKVGAEGKATLYWFDHSVSRLAAGTELTIDHAAYNPENINETDINFEVVSGEVWSKVQAIVEEDSEFLGYAGDVVAGVRGSVFNIAVADDEVVVESIAHALTVGDKTIVSGEEAGFKKKGGEEKYRDAISSETWGNEWFRDNLQRDEADQQRMMAAMMEKLRGAIGSLPGEPDFMERVEKIDRFMKSDAEPAKKKAVKAKIVALVRAMDILPSDRLFPMKVMLQEKLIEWENDMKRKRFMMEKQIEMRLYALYDWVQHNDPTPEQLRTYLQDYRGMLGGDYAFFEQNPDMIKLIREIVEVAQDKMPEIAEDMEFLRVIDKIDEIEERTAEPVSRTAPIRQVDPNTIRLLDVPAVTTEPRDVIEEEAPFYRGESNV